MAGGNYTTMNKIRPGAYFQRITDIPAPAGFNPEGILCWVHSTRWGNPAVRITLDDYNLNRIYNKCGMDAGDEHLQIWAQYGRELVIANPNVGMEKASATIREPGTGEKSVTNGLAHIEVSYIHNGQRKWAKELSILLTGAGDTVGFGDNYDIEFHDGTSTNVGYTDTLTTLGDLVSDISAHLAASVSDTITISDVACVLYIDGKRVTSSTATPSELEKGSYDCNYGDLQSGVKVTGDITFPVDSGLYAQARYGGTLGNELSIVVAKVTSLSRDVRTTLNGVVVDSQIISDWNDFKDNDWIVLSGLRGGLPEESDPINLSGGTDGEALSVDRIVTDAFECADGETKSVSGIKLPDLTTGQVLLHGTFSDITDSSDNPIPAEEGLEYTISYASGAPDIPEYVKVDTDAYGNLVLTNVSMELDWVYNGTPLKIVGKKPNVAVVYAMGEDESSNANVDGVQIKADTVTHKLQAFLNGVKIGESPMSTQNALPSAIRITLPASRGGAVVDLKPFLLSESEFGNVVTTYIVETDLPKHPVVSATAVSVKVGGGNHGNTAPYGILFRELRFHNWSVLVLDDQSKDSIEDASKYVRELREDCGLYRRLVVCDPPIALDYENAINPYDEDYLTVQATTWRGDKSISAFVRACLALAKYNESNTYAEIPIDDKPDQMLNQVEIENCLRQGYSLCTRRDDDVYVIEKDINSFHTYTDANLYALTKNRIIRTTDYLCNILRYRWELQYCGKVHNDDIGRAMWKSTVQEILNAMVEGRGLNDYIEPIVTLGNKLDEVITVIGVFPIDSMEIVYVQIKLNV